MKSSPHSTLLSLLLIGALLLAACSNPGYNDNPSQQMTKATVGCLVANDFYATYFSAYIKPADDNAKAATVKDKKALFRSYCKDIPTTGTAFFTADLVGKELRETPIGIRVVEQELTGDDSKAESFKDIRTLVEIPAKLYPRGAVEAQAKIDKNGYYAIYLAIGGEEAISDEDKLRIPLHVGVDPDAKPIWVRMGIIVGITLAFALFAFVAYRFMRRRNAD
jgi:type II secretory pathway pseudopilin PulG